MRPILIGLDLGTTLCKCGAFDTEGNLICSASHKITTNHEIAGGAEQDPAEWIAALQEVMTAVAGQLGEKRQDIVSIGLSCHGPGVVLTDEAGTPLLPCAIWQDNRSALCGEVLLQEVGCDWVGHGMPKTGFAARVRWLNKERPEILQRATYVHCVKSFLIYVFTGNFVSEPSSSGGIEEWTEELLRACGVRREQLPRVVRSEDVAGMLKEEIAKKVGFPVVPIVGGLNDGAAAMYGSGAIELGDGVISVSTNGISRVVVDKKPTGKYLFEHSLFCWPYVDGKYVMGGFTKSAGDTVQWWQDVAFSGVNPKERMDCFNTEAAQSEPGSRGVYFYPWLLGRGAPNATDHAEGCFWGLARHHSRGDCARAVMEGLSYALYDIGLEFRSLGYSWNNIRLTGGAMKCALWRSIIVNLLGIRCAFVKSDSLLGVAMLAGVGCGIYHDAREAYHKCVKDIEDAASLEPELSAFYREAFEKYQASKNVLSQLTELMGR